MLLPPPALKERIMRISGFQLKRFTAMVLTACLLPQGAVNTWASGAEDPGVPAAAEAVAETETASPSNASVAAAKASSSDALVDEDGFLIDGAVMNDAAGENAAGEIVPEEILPEAELKKEKIEAAEVLDEEGWYSDYEYVLDADAQTLTVTKYTGDEDDIYVPAETEIDGTVYATVVKNAGSFQNSVWGGRRTTLTLIVFEDGVRLTGTASGMFSSYFMLRSADLSHADASDLWIMDDMFHDCSALETVDLSGMNTENVRTVGHMFEGCSSLTSVDLDGFDTGNANNYQAMFGDCSSLKSIDISGFDTGKAYNMHGMFSGCSALEEVDFSGLEMEELAVMSEMFRGCSSLKRIDLSGINAGNVYLLKRMFEDCTALESADLRGLGASKIEYAEHLFYNCTSLETLDMTGINFHSVYDGDQASGMLMYCRNLETFYVPFGVVYGCDLPHTMYDEAGISWTSVPPDLAESVRLTRTVRVSSVKINTTSRTIPPGQTFQLKAWPQPTNAEDRSVTWESSNPEVASVDDAGLVTANQAGTAVVTATTADGGYTAECTITVSVPVTSVKINTATRTIAPGKTFQLAAWPQPTNATNKNVTWSSSNTAVATVDSTGLVKAVKAGTATITVKTVDGGKTATCKITVN